jgi:hypothetical protein
MNAFPVVRAHDLGVVAAANRWLVEGLWADEAVGIVGGEPKCCKSFLALDLAVSVAAGTPCLRRFPVVRRGPVLLYAAEDALHVVRSRLDGICHLVGVDLAALDVHVITAPTLRLDRREDRTRLADTIDVIRPVLLVLDPFVRLHRIDENVSSEVAPLLATLREMQRQHHVAVVLVHHARKGGGAGRPGQALRGSSELHAWGDCNLYLQRARDQLTLTVEHRAAIAPAPMQLELRGTDDRVALHVVEARVEHTDATVSVDPAARVLAILRDAHRPLTVRELRARCAMRTDTLCRVLADLRTTGHVRKDADGYAVA